jgi:solute carrier family 34 (sodium-dependent phosphate cotransporter)
MSEPLKPLKARKHDPAEPPDPASPPELEGDDVPAPVAKLSRRAATVLALLLLYVFIVGVGVLGEGFGELGEGFQDTLLSGVQNPVAGLFAGMLATVLVTSSSVSTSTIVALVGSGILPVELAIPMVMGANLGTTVTNTLVSLFSIRNPDEFRRAFSAATMHDLYNVMAVLILLPLELLTGYLERVATALASPIEAAGITGADVDGPLSFLTGPAEDLIVTAMGAVVPEGGFLGVVLLLLGIAIIFTSLRYITKVMRLVLGGGFEQRLNSSVSRGAGLMGVLFGAVGAIVLFTSTVVTVMLIPLCAAGILALRNAYPITIGANIGTTMTALLAALAVDETAGLVIALVHFTYNVTAVLIIYPLPQIRYIPLRVAMALGNQAAKRRWVVFVYVGGFFVGLPLTMDVLINQRFF